MFRFDKRSEFICCLYRAAATRSNGNAEHYCRCWSPCVRGRSASVDRLMQSTCVILCVWRTVYLRPAAAVTDNVHPVGWTSLLNTRGQAWARPAQIPGCLIHSTGTSVTSSPIRSYMDGERSNCPAIRRLNTISPMCLSVHRNLTTS